MPSPLPPDKKPFGWPLGAAVLAHFVHPGGEPEFARPFLHDGSVHTCNRWIAVRWDKMDTAGVEECPAASARLAKVPMGNVALLTEEVCWRKIDEARLSIYRFPPKSLWQRVGACFGAFLLPMVRIGDGAITALSILQLIGRLPRCSVWCAGGPQSPLYVRFNGGTAVVAPIPPDVQECAPVAFGIFAPPRCCFTGEARWQDRAPRPSMDRRPSSSFAKDIHHDDLPVYRQDGD